MRRWILGALIMPTFLVCAQGAWGPYVEGWGRYGDWRQGGSANAFVPVHQGRSTIGFIEAAGLRLRNQSVASVGMGARQFVRPSIAAGINGFFDYTRSDSHHSYYQVGLGAEIFTRCFEGRINGYIPLKFRQEGTVGENEAVLVGTLLFDSIPGIREAVYGGFDAEAGYVRPVGPGYLRSYAGYFYFQTRESTHFQGPRLRLRYEWDNPLCLCKTRLTIGGQWQYDHIRKNEARLVVGIRIPFGHIRRGKCRCKSSICRRMGDPVHREPGAIIANGRGQTLTPIFGPGGDQLQSFFFNAIGGGPGTQSNPTTLMDAQAMANPYDILFGLQDEGDVLNPGTSLQQGQQLAGFGDNANTTLTIFGGIPLTIIDETGAGRVVIDGPIIGLADNALVTGIETMNTPINGFFTEDATVSDVIMDAAGMLNFTNSTGLLIEDVTINMAPFQNMNLNNSVDTTLRNITLVGGGMAGMSLVDGVATTNLAIENSSFTMVNTSVDSILRTISSSNVSITNTDFMFNPVNSSLGLELSGFATPTTNIAMTDVSISNAEGLVGVVEGISINGVRGTVTLTNVILDNCGEVSLQASSGGPSFTASITGMQILPSSVVESVLYINGGTATVSNSVFQGDLSADAGIYVAESVAAVPGGVTEPSIVTIQNSEFRNEGTVRLGGTIADATLQIVGNTFRDTDSIVLVRHPGVGQTSFVTISDNDFVDGSTGIEFSTPATLTTNAVLTALVSDNRFDTATAPVFAENTITGAGSVLNLTIRDNMASGAPSPTYEVLGSGLLTCTTIKGNDSDTGGTAINVNGTLGTTTEVTDIASLSTDNMGISVTTSGAVNRATDCPLPPS